MSALAPCTSCARHVRRTESACPFCGATLALGAAPTPRVITERLGRAALFSVGAAIVASVPGCGNAVPAYGAPAVDTGPMAADAGQPGPLYGAPTVDAGHDAGQPATLYGGPFPTEDAGVGDPDSGSASSDYGAPPAP